jgi:carboxymethylenebutenolidase
MITEFLTLPAIPLVSLVVAFLVRSDGRRSPSRRFILQPLEPRLQAVRDGQGLRAADDRLKAGLQRPGYIALAALALVTAPVAARAEGESGESNPTAIKFSSGGKDIAVDRFAPREPGQYPALVVLHAVDGLDGACAGFYRDAARGYAARGYVILLVHYFDRTGNTAADLRGYRDLFARYFRQKEHRPADVQKMKGLLLDWTATARDAVAHARRLPGVAPDRVGLVGFSLGAAVALNAAADPDVKAAALVEFFGALPAELRAGVAKLPPTLIFHGDQDRVVPVEEAWLLAGMLLARDLQPEVKVFPGVGHMFFARDGKTLEPGPVLLAKLRTDAFLDKHLKPRTQAASARSGK